MTALAEFRLGANSTRMSILRSQFDYPLAGSFGMPKQFLSHNLMRDIRPAVCPRLRQRRIKRQTLGLK
jgi:hypothetical protein